jgi:hypothetical protein
MKDCTADRSSSIHVFPIEKVPFAFSLALCILTRPDLRTATIIRRGFLVAGLEAGGGGVEGKAASSSILI